MFGVQTILSTLILAAVPTAEDVTLLFVTTPGCVPCQQAAPLIREIAEMGYPVQHIDASKHPDLAQQLNVRQFPTLLMIANGKVVDQVVPVGDPTVLKPRILKMFDFVAPPQQNQSPPVPVFAPIQPPTALPVSFTTTAPENAGVPTKWEGIGKSNSGAEVFLPWIASSVKLRVDAENTHSWGTGTIVDTRKGEALVLTCGHIFRDSKGAGKIEVHLFGSNSSAKVFGRCLYYDLEIDLALVAIVPPCPVRAIPIAPVGYQVQAGQDVLSVGCDNGADPSVRSHRVLSTDRIGTPVENAIPFHYVQVAGAPVSGRSGGGLFAPEGYLIGVCNTADPVENDGHFVPPKVIQMVLDKLQLSSVYQNPSLGDAEIVGIPESAGVPNHAGVPAKWGGSPIDAAMAKPLNLNDKERATLEEIQRRAQDGDEVILIVRSRRNPEIPSNVIILNGTSDQFLEALTQHQSVIRDDSVHESIEAPPRPLRPIASGPQTVSFPVFH